MALTRDFKETVMARAQRDRKFREALFSEAINAYLAGDIATGKAMLRDLVDAKVGFAQLAAEVQKPSKSLHRMLAPRGNPNTENFFGIVSALQNETRVRLQVGSERNFPCATPPTTQFASLKRHLRKAPQLAAVELLGPLRAQQVDRAQADAQVLVDALAVEAVGHAGQLDLAVQRLVADA